MKNKILVVIFSVLIISCRGQERDKIKKNKENINLSNLTLLGVNKTDSLYTVNNRCDGGYPVLRFYKNKFYFYIPQEGTYFLTESIEGNGNNSYKITTNGYYFLANEKPIQDKSIWHLKKINQLLWNFSNDKLNTNYQLADSTSLINKKIAFYDQPCKECWDEEQCAELEPKNNLKTKVEIISSQDAVDLAKKDFLKNELPKLKNSNKDIGGIDVLEGYVGDLTNDKLDDIVVFYSLTAKGGNVDINSGLAVYQNKDNKLLLVENIIPNYMFSVKKIFNNRIYIEKIEYAENDGRCCPSLKSEVQLKVNNK
jgi:hypothetical protein